MGINAFLVGDYKKKFLERRKYIENHTLSFPYFFDQAKEQKKQRQSLNINLQLTNEEIEKIFDVAAFMDQGELYMYPEHYSHVFGRSLKQIDTQKISEHVQPDRLISLGGRAEVAIFVGIYTENELIQYVDFLNQLANSFGSDFAISLGSTDHLVGFCYSHRDKEWWLIDANQVPKFIKSTDTLCLVNELKGIFQENICYIATRIITAGVFAEELKLQVNNLLISEPFLSIHDITETRVKQCTPLGINLPWAAAEFGLTALLIKIAALKNSEGNFDANFNQTNNYGITPANIAAQNGHIEVLKFLAELKNADGRYLVDFNIPDVKGMTPAIAAVASGHIEILKFLAELKNADGSYLVDFITADVKGTTPALHAVACGDIEVLKFLAELKNADGSYLVDFNIANVKGTRPAPYAVTCSDIEVLKFLAELRNIEGSYRVDFNIPNATPALIAAEKGSLEILKFLSELKNVDGSYRIDFNKSNNKGATLVHMAAQNGHAEVLHFLSKLIKTDGSYLVDFDIPLEDGATPTYIAAYMGQMEVLQLFARLRNPDDSYRVNFNTQDKTGFTPTLIATQQGHIKALQLFAELKNSDDSFLVNFNTPCNNLATPLHLAALTGNCEIVRFLVDQKVNLFPVTKSGFTPSDLARMKGYTTIVNLLKLKKLDGSTNQKRKRTDEEDCPPSKVPKFF